MMLSTDTIAPAAPEVALTTDSGRSNSDRITNNAALTVTNVEVGATVEYKVDDGEWSDSYDPTILADGLHTVRVRVTDAADNASTSAIAFTLDRAAPTNLQIGPREGLVAEKASIGTKFATLSAFDVQGGGFTYALVTDGTGDTPAQNPFFEIDGDKIQIKAALNDDQVGFHQLWVKVTDAAGYSLVRAIMIGVYNTEEAPENVSLTLANQPLNELAANGTEVGTLTATDQDAGNSVTFRLVDDAGGRFEIANGKIVVKNGLKLDYEQARSHKVTVEAKDVTGLVTQQTFTINLGNVNGETVSGTAASEAFFGGAGLDVLNGGSGNDTLGGGLGNDVLTGGTGRDAFVFNTALNKSTNVDTISSFSTRDDTIRLENAVFKKLTKTGTLNKDFFATGTKAKDKNDYIVYNNRTGALYYDADGSGKGAAVKFAQLPTKLGLTNADFFVI
ncbi:cadherin domain-containing protein [Microvirga pakistanensis]|uniref:cadherin domain-containing protein n=1 Tax=Microvirga pakistanensis TaxID=1682650 RepID=UPI00106D8284|nr:cadherin domain-containing protein [Microvirga pakistanensis]